MSSGSRVEASLVTELIELWWYFAEYLFLLFSDSDVIPLKGECMPMLWVL